MTAHDHDAADQLDRVLDRLARGDEQSAAGLDPWLAAAVRAVRTHEEAPAPDPAFVARLRETLLMDASIPVPGPVPGHVANGRSLSRASSLPPLPLTAPDARHRDARRHLIASAVPAPVPTGIGTRRRSLVRRWNRHGWPIVELLGAAALILGLVSVMLGGGNGGLPALVPGFGQTTQVSTPVADLGEVAMAQGNAGRTGEMTGPGVASDPTVVWSKSISNAQYPGAYTAAPVVANDVLFSVSQGDHGSQVSAYDVTTGNVRWQASVPNGRFSFGSPAVSNGLVVVPVTDFPQLSSDEPAYATPGETPEPIIDTGELLALNVQTGQEVWHFETGGIGDLSPLVVGDFVYVTDGLGVVQAVSVKSGQEIWKATVPVRGGAVPFASLSAADGFVFVATNLGILYALDAETGDESWSAGLGGNYPTTPVVADGTVYVGSSGVTDTTGDTGEFFTSSNPNDATPPVEPPSPVADGTGRLYAINGATGDTNWSVDLDHVLRPSPTVTNGMVILSGVGENGDQIVALDADTGMNQLWSLTTDGNVDASVAVTDGTGYVGTYGSTFYAIDLSDGSIAWSVRTSGPIQQQAFVSGGLVFLSNGGNRSTLYALGQSSDATPTATSDSPVDISGLPACNVEPRPDLQATPLPPSMNTVPTVTLPDETPEYTLPGIDPGEYQTQQPVIAWSDIPVGMPATDEQVAGISNTLQQMVDCDRTGNGRYLAAFYTDDYFLRPWVVWNLAFNGYQFWTAPTQNTDEASVAANIRVLPDGRIALIESSPSAPEYGQLFIFVEQDSQWLIDEFEEVTPDGVFHGG
jgi:outer membrane protein assembly factor BamB